MRTKPENLASWRIREGKLVVPLSGLRGDLAESAALYSEEWSARGWLADGALSLTGEAWFSLATPPNATAAGGDPEDQLLTADAWAAQHLLLLDLVGIEQQRLVLDGVGFLGGANFRMDATLDGIPLRFAEPASEGFLGYAPDGAARLLSPLVAWALREATALHGADMREQNVRCARIVGGFAHTEELLENRVTLERRGYLATIEPLIVEKVSLRWEPSEHLESALSLRLEAVAPDGQRCVIPQGAHLGDGVLNLGDPRRPAVLPRGAEVLLDQAANFQLRSDPEVQELIAHPMKLFPEGLDVDGIFDLTGYSDRVLGFERLTGRQPPVKLEGSGITWFLPSDDPADAFMSVSIGDHEDAESRLTIPTREAAVELLSRVTEALAQGTQTIFQLSGHNFEPTIEVVEQLRAALEVDPPLPPTSPESPDAGSLEVPSTESSGQLAARVAELEASDLDHAGPRVSLEEVPWTELSRLLQPGVELKEHQRRGIAWMWHHARAGSNGLLLADDMGLGKTLQVAGYLAMRRCQGSGGSRPQLVVCPTILLGNWDQEIQRFFRPGCWDSVFVLHGPGLALLKRPDGSLKTDFLRTQDLILTNYETLGAYQLSLLQMDFDVVVFDEAHNIKNPHTLRSRAARALKRDFSIAMTGTPVENELTDLWAIYDAIQPGPPRTFGTESSFRSLARQGDAISQVRRRLKYPSTQSTLLRREKAEALRDLPPKRQIIRQVPMTAAQEARERQIVASVKTRGPLWGLAELQKLYQQAGIQAGMDDAAAARHCPKVGLCLEILDEIAAKGEKALIFAHYRRAQELLSRLISKRFDLSHVPIINGDPTNRRSALSVIDAFGKQRGFATFVLSPIAAGAGLNIVAANHVIHYGRWWNPAKEDQATDRAHRIGQAREVHVYYPLLHHRGRPEAGFDIGLHNLIEQKRGIARDFLAPAPNTEAEEELLGVFRRVEEG